MNNDPQLTIFEPSKKPRTVTLKVTEDTDSDTVTIFDENGCKVTDYTVLYDESQSVISTDKEKIAAYIKDWESQGNAVNEKQARKIDKRKRNQERKKLRKERNRKRKANMKSLIHCNFDTSPLANAKDVEEERAILRAMKTQKHKLKNIFNIKPNRIINCNTNVRPFENSTIEIGSRKKPIDVVVLDSDEETELDSDEIQINIDTPPCNRRATNFSNDCSIRNRNSVVTSDSNTKKRNKKVEFVEIIDSSDSDVECVSCEEFIESLSDDDDNDKNSSLASKKARFGNINLENKSAQNSEEVMCVPEDEDASNELVSLVDNFVNKYIQTTLPPLSEMLSQTDPQFPASQIVIMEPISLQPESSPAQAIKSQTNQIATPQFMITGSVSLSPAAELQKNENAVPSIVISEPVSLQPRPPTQTRSKQSQKQVAFNHALDEKAVDDDELVLIENKPPDNESKIQDLVDQPVQPDSNVEEEKNHNNFHDSNYFDISSEQDDGQCNRNVIEFDSIPSPDYTPTENIPATASNIKAFADFIRSRKMQELTKDDMSDYDFPNELEESTPGATVRCAPKPNTHCSASSECHSFESEKQSCQPWRKRSHNESNEIQVVQHSALNYNRPFQSSEKRCHETNKIQILEQSAVNRNQSSRPWYERNDGEFDESHIEYPTKSQCQSSYLQNKPTSKVNQSEKFYQANFNSQEYRRNAFINQRYQRRPYLRNAPPSRNSAVEFLDKKSIKIGESQNESEKICNENSVKPEDFMENIDGPYRKFYPKKFFNDGRNNESNEPYQGQSDSQSRPFYQKFPQQQKCGTASICKEPWRRKSYSETRITGEEEINEMKYECEPQQLQERSETTVRDDYCAPDTPFKLRNRYAPEPYEEQKCTPKRNKYHPKPYEEDKFVPKSEPSFNHPTVPWRNTNRGRSYRGQFRRIDQCHYRQMEYNRNNFSQNNRFHSKFPPKQVQRFDSFPPNQRFPRRYWQNASTYGREAEEEQYSNCDQQSSCPPHNQYRNQSEVPLTQLSNTCSSQKAGQEVLFTRRCDKFEYKANVGDFYDFNDQQEQPSEQISCYRNSNTNSNQQNCLENYEANVAKKLHSNSNNEDTFSWENNQSCDFVPLSVNESVTSSAPWHCDTSSSIDNPRINAISRQVWISGKKNKI